MIWEFERQLAIDHDRDIRPSIPGIAIHAPDLLMASPLPSHISMITLALTTSTTTQYLSSHVQFLHLTPHNGEYGEGRHFLSTSYVILYLVFFPLTYRLTDRRIYICVQSYFGWWWWIILSRHCSYERMVKDDKQQHNKHGLLRSFNSLEWPENSFSVELHLTPASYCFFRFAGPWPIFPALPWWHTVPNFIVEQWMISRWDGQDIDDGCRRVDTHYRAVVA
jgi:hypothetical protein